MLELHRNKKELRVISDQIGSPTTTTSLWQGVAEINSNGNKKQSIPEIIHWCNKGIKRYDIAVEIGEIAKELNLIIMQKFSQLKVKNIKPCIKTKLFCSRVFLLTKLLD